MIFDDKCTVLAEPPPALPQSTNQRLFKLFEWMMYYLIVGTIYCWMTVLVDKLANLYAELLFYPIRNFPNSSRVVIVISAVMIHHYLLAILTGLCFFGQIIWVRKKEAGPIEWNLAVFGFTVLMLVLVYRLTIMYLGEWMSQRSYRLQMIKLTKERNMARLREFIHRAQDGLIP